MEWLQGNWLWILFVIAVFAMHVFGHGGHGHGGQRRHDHHGRTDSDKAQAAHPEFNASRQGREPKPWQEG